MLRLPLKGRQRAEVEQLASEPAGLGLILGSTAYECVALGKLLPLSVPQFPNP